MQWLQNPTVESFLQENKIPFHWTTDVLFSEINLEKSRKNNARVLTETIDEDLVQCFATAMEDGRPFFGCVCYQNGSGKLFADGNHRGKAFSQTKEGKKKTATIGCYVLDTDDQLLIDLATRGLNTLVGKGQDKEERIEQALAMLTKYPHLTTAGVAKAWKLSQHSLAHALRARKTAKSLERKVAGIRDIPRTAMLELSKLEHSEPALIEAASVVVDNDMKIDDVKCMVQAANAAKSDSARVEAIKKYADKYKNLAPKPIERKRNDVSKLHGFIGSIQTILGAGRLSITSKSEKDSLLREWGKTCDLMAEVLA